MRLASDGYILAGNSIAAIALLPTLSAEQDSLELARTKAQIAVAVDVGKILDSGQLSLLKQKLGDDELVKLLGSLSGGRGGEIRGSGGPQGGGRH